MTKHNKPDICFESKNSKVFEFMNNAYTFKLNEVYDKSFYICKTKTISNNTILTVDTDKNSSKIVIGYIVLKDIENVENIVITPADGIELIWIKTTGTIETGKNYIIQFKQINQTTILASLTNSTLTRKGDTPEPPPPPPIPQEISAIYFAMPQSGTMLYDMFTWYDEKKDVWPEGATDHLESVQFLIPQIIDGNVVWKLFTNYVIEDNMIKIPVEDVDEESFLSAINNNYNPLFTLQIYYRTQLSGQQCITVDYPIIWDNDDSLGVSGEITLLNTMAYQVAGLHVTTISYLNLYDINSQLIANILCFEGHTGTATSAQWPSGNSGILKAINSQSSAGGVSVQSHEGIKTGFKRGFIIDTNYDTTRTKISINGAAQFYISGQTSALNPNTNKPYMPYGDTTLNYVKFEYKEVE